MSKLLTASGRVLDLLNPQPNQISLHDIALGLSRESRFNGQTSRFYCVAQHSYLAAELVPEPFKLEALLHDATEAYIKDIPRPLKTLLNDYQEVERRLDLAIREHFGLPLAPLSPAVVEADLILLATERRDLMPNSEHISWPCLEGVKPLNMAIEAWTEREAFFNFMAHAESYLVRHGC